MYRLSKTINLLLFGVFLFFGLSISVRAQTPNHPTAESHFETARVLGLSESQEETSLYDIELKNKHRSTVNSYGDVLATGSSIFVETTDGGKHYYYVAQNRTKILSFLVILFVASVLILARRKGLRSLGSLLLSFLLLFLVFIPALFKGYDPLWLTLFFGLFVLSVSIFVTHGMNRQSLTSFLGAFGSILLALALLVFVLKVSSVSGILNEDFQYLAIQTKESLDIVRLISAGILIGVLGVLDDITITQVAVVRELSSHPHMNLFEIFKRALRVGRDHISSLVNTLVFAYVGATLPLIMLISLMDIPWYILISQEFIFVEIVRSLVGAIALVIAVPLTTWLAVYVFFKGIKEDKTSLESACAHEHH